MMYLDSDIKKIAYLAFVDFYSLICSSLLNTKLVFFFSPKETSHV